MSEVDRRRSIPVDEAIPLLQATPATLRSLLAPLPMPWLDFQEDPTAWSPRMVLVHFIHNERANWIPRARVILSNDEDRRFVPFQQMPAPGEVVDQGVASMLDQFASLRHDSLATLLAFNLRPEDWLRTGQHPSLGRVTLAQLLATWVVHDLNHTHQILKSLAKLQTDAVGPWRKYLAILDM
jgi:DinB superfamily